MLKVEKVSEIWKVMKMKLFLFHQRLSVTVLQVNNHLTSNIQLVKPMMLPKVVKVKPNSEDTFHHQSKIVLLESHLKL
eukprot:jgi/Orpsp1_1/1182417/evm.model.c7180000081198.1